MKEKRQVKRVPKEERRKAERVRDCDSITITVLSEGENLPKEEIYNYSEDISVTGAKIRANILLPVDTLLKIDFTVHPLYEQITALGKVKWIKVVIDDKWYEAGVEFADTPNEAIKKLEEYISWKKKSYKS
jgi:hypothetical protein